MHNNFNQYFNFYLLYNVNFILHHTALLQDAMEKLLVFMIIVFFNILNGP